MRYFIYFAYNGTAYHGWQVQPNGVSVQEMLEKALSIALQVKTDVLGAGRTDAGVHAEMMVAHFDAESDLILTEGFVRKLNNILPFDISVDKIIPVADDAHARFDAVSRKYEYRLVMNKNVFKRDVSVRMIFPLDFNRMNEAASKLFFYSDFTSFSKLHTDAKTNNCKIMQAEWVQRGDEWVFIIKADRFLRNMVRAIVGTLLEVGRGKMTVDEFCRVIEAKDRCKAGVSVPARGLFLVEILY